LSVVSSVVVRNPSRLTLATGPRILPIAPSSEPSTAGMTRFVNADVLPRNAFGLVPGPGLTAGSEPSSPAPARDTG
jgi:hypothetical protein